MIIVIAILASLLYGSNSIVCSCGISFSGINIGGDNQKTTKAPVTKALRAGLVEITNYLSCVMVDKGSCVAEFEKKEQRRRENTQKVLELE